MAIPAVPSSFEGNVCAVLVPISVADDDPVALEVLDDAGRGVGDRERVGLDDDLGGLRLLVGGRDPGELREGAGAGLLVEPLRVAALWPATTLRIFVKVCSRSPGLMRSGL